MHKVDNVNPSAWFPSVGLNPVQRTKATDDPMNLVQSRSNTDIRKNFSVSELYTIGIVFPVN